MEKSPIKSNWVLLTVTACGLLAIIAGYALVYAPSREDYYVRRDLRLLGHTADRLKGTIESLPLATDFAAKSLNTVNLTNVVEDEERLLLLRRAVKLIPSLTFTRIELGENQQTSRPFELVAKRDGAGDRLEMNYSKLAAPQARCFVTFEAKCDLELLVGNRPEFDGLLVVRRQEGEVLFQRLAGPTRLLSLSELVTVDGKPINTGQIFSASGRLSVRLGPDRYELFSQPMEVKTKESGGPEQWILCGLVRYNRFKEESLIVYYNVPVIIGFLFLLIVASLPFLKLAWAPLRDRIRTLDLWGLGLSSAGVPALLTLISCFVLGTNRLERDMLEQLKTLSDQLDLNFSADAIQLHHLATRFDHEFASVTEPELRRNLLATNSPVGDLIEPHQFLQVSWIGRDGMQIRKWSARPSVTALTNVGTRNYFRDAWSQNRFSPFASNDGQYWVEPIYSWATGDNSAVLSVFNGWQVIAIESRLPSLIRPVLAPALGFCVVTDDGKVLFHSDASRSLRENFFEECEQNLGLRGLIENRQAGPLDVTYLGRRHQLFVRRMKLMPWTLITFQEEHALSALGFDVQAVAFALFAMYVLVLALFWSVIFLGIRALRPKTGSWSALLDLAPSWIWPQECNRMAYSLIVMLNLFLTIIVAGFLTWPGLRDWPSLVAVFVFGTPSLAALGSLAFLRLAEAFRTDKEQTTRWPRLKKLLVPSDDRGADPAPDKVNDDSGKAFVALPNLSCSCKWSYVLALASIALPIAVLPASAFYTIAFKERMELFVKLQQFKLAQSLIERSKRLETEFNSIHRGSINFEARLEDLLSVTNYSTLGDVYQMDNLAVEVRAYQPDKYHGVINDHFHWFFEWLLRLREAKPFETRGVFSKGAGDETWHWDRGKSGGLCFHWERYRPGQMLKICSPDTALRPGSELALLIALGLSAIMYGAWMIGHYVFLLDAKPRTSWAEDKFTGPLKESLLLLGVRSQVHDSLREDIGPRLRPAWTGARIEDWSRHFDEESLRAAPPGLILIDHLDHRGEDPSFNLRKVKVIESLLRNGQHTLIIFSTTSPHLLPLPQPPSQDAKTTNPNDRCDRWDSIERSLTRLYLKSEFHAEFPARWRICSNDEQLALHQVASDGFLSARNPALPSLLGRGLLTRFPRLSLRDSGEINERYVTRTIAPEVLRYAESQCAAGFWRRLRMPAAISILVIGGLLSINQPDVYKIFTLLFTTLTGGPPALSRLLALLDSRKGGSTEAA
jgi:hypothetical protein